VAKFCFRSVELVRESVGWNTGPGNSLRRLQRQQTDRKGCRSDNGVCRIRRTTTSVCGQVHLSITRENNTYSPDEIAVRFHHRLKGSFRERALMRRSVTSWTCGWHGIPICFAASHLAAPPQFLCLRRPLYRAFWEAGRPPDYPWWSARVPLGARSNHRALL